MSRALALSASALAFVAVVSGCRERTLSEGDCALIKERLEKAWNRDAVASQRLADTDKFNPFIRDEGDRIGDSWMEQCRTMVGRPVKESELVCLNAAETIDDVYACAR